MTVLSHRIAGALGLALILPMTAQAQKSCEVDEGRPSQVARATLAVQMATNTQDPAAAARQLTSAVRMLTERPGQISNQMGRNFVLGKALVLWSTLPNVPLVTTRGALGYTVNPTEQVDLTALIDSSFKVVETAHPECIAETSTWRGYKTWVTLVNTAIERLNAEDVDSAAALAGRAATLNPYAPYGFVVLANVAQKRGNSSEAFRLYRQAIDAAGTDTTYADIRRQSLLYLGTLAADSAEMAADAAAKRPYVDVAKRAFEELLRDTTATEMFSSARTGMCRVNILMGDTAQLRESYRAQLTAPAQYTDFELMNAGLCFARADMVPEATVLFRASYDKNPYHRDALSNLAIMYLNKDNFEAAIPLATRLEQVEPNNADNIQLLVLSYAGIARRAQAARRAGAPQTGAKAATKAGARGAAAPRLSAAAADSLFKIEQAYSDSALKANERREKLAYRVSLGGFSNNDDKATLSGSVSNTGTESKPITISVDFLNRHGEIVQTKTQDLGAIAPGSSASFNVTATPGTNISAFRYKRIG